ncbi:MAG: alpha/beta fold hydrolase [Sporichthyaceae bacterium]
MRLELALTDFGGVGPPLVLGPSLGTTVATLWGPAAQYLTNRHRVIGWDLPGHGASVPATGFGIDDLAEAVLAAVGDTFAYAGVSIGGAVGLALLLGAADSVEHATLLSTAAWFGDPTPWRERAARVRADGTGWLVEATPQRWFAPANRESPVAKALMQDLAAADAESYACACEALTDFDVRDALPTVSTPVVAIAGEHDPVTTVEHLRTIAERVRRGRLEVIADAAHQAVAEHPEQVAALIP